MNAHVPEVDRKVDARTLLPTFSVRQALRSDLRESVRRSRTLLRPFRVFSDSSQRSGFC